MSHGGDRLIVNCGPNLVHGADWRLAARGLAAHSTLAFDADVTDPFLRHGLAAKRLGPRVKGEAWQVTGRRVEDKSGIWLETSHAIFLETHGVRHNRRFFIDAAGEDIRGGPAAPLLAGVWQSGSCGARQRPCPLTTATGGMAR